MRVPLRQYWTLLADYLRPLWRGVAVLTMLLFADIGLQLLNPQIVRYFIDTALAGGATDRLAAAAGLFILVALITQALAVAATYMGENVAWAATNALRGDLVAHCLGLDQSFHTRHTPGELIERLDGDVTVLANFFSRLVIDVLGNMVLLAGVLVLLFREDTRVGLGLTLFVLVTFAALMGLRTRAVPRWIADREASARFFGALGEQLGGPARWRCRSIASPSDMARTRRCCTTSRSTSRRGGCWDCWDAPAAGRRPSRACCAGSPIPRRAWCAWAVCRCARRVWTSCATTSPW